MPTVAARNPRREPDIVASPTTPDEARHGAIINAVVHTMVDPTQKAEALLWKHGRIALVGSTAEVAAAAAAAGIKPIDARQQVVIPGFVDAHTHFLHVGVKRLRPDLRGLTSRQACLAAIRQWLHEHPAEADSDAAGAGGGVIGEGWDEADWPVDDRRPPTIQELDEVTATTGRPLVFRRICGHVAYANTAALNLVRRHWDTDRLVNLDTGRLDEDASLYLNEVMPTSDADLDYALQKACDVAHRRGVTTVGDYSQAPYRRALQRAATAGRLTVRTSSSVYVQQLEAEIAAGFQTGRRHDLGNAEVAPASPSAAAGRWLQDGGLKIFLDGSLGAHTAWMREPYADLPPDHPHPTGVPNWSQQDIDSLTTKAHAAGIQLHLHAIGDAAVEAALDAIQALDQRRRTQLRHRIEHDEILPADLIAKHVTSGAVASSQPNFVGEWSRPPGPDEDPDDVSMYAKRLGPERIIHNNPFGRLRAAGVPLAFGSDGMPFGPLVGIAAAVDHPVPGQALDAATAIWHYTHQAAWSLHWEDDVGTLEVGKCADLVLLSTGRLHDPDSHPSEWSILATWSDGILRHEER